MMLRACGFIAAGAYFALAMPSLSQSSVTYQYDGVGRLTQSTYGACQESGYTFDKADNRTRVVTVSGAALTALDDTVSTNENAALTFDPRANDCSTQNYALSVTGTGTAGHGSVSYTTSSVTYTPTNGYFGADSFTYSISDGHGNSKTATVNMTVVGVPPVAFSGTEYFTKAQGTLDIIASCTDSLGYALTITSVTQPLDGVAHVAIVSNKLSISNMFDGETTSFTYTISDGHGGTAVGTVYIDVTITL